MADVIKFIALTILATLIIGAGILVGRREQPATLPTAPPHTEPIVEPVEPAPLNPLSIAAARAREYDGRELTLGRVLDDNSLYTRYFVTYKSGELTISGILNIPKGDGPFPVIITNHGYIDPAVYTNGRGLRREQDYLARRGFAVLHPDYRCHAQSDCPEGPALANRLGYTEDVINAVKAIQRSTINKLDKEKIGMLGHSMGGGIAYGVSVILPDLVGAFVFFAPVSPNTVDSYERWLATRPEVVQEIREAYGEPAENPEFWAAISPVTYFADMKAPLQIHHGTADDSVPLEWSEKTVNRLRELGKNVEFFTYPNEPHEFIAAWPLVIQRTASFFRTNLHSYGLGRGE
jgi:dipeptidyl aminopeptidase/acylaminoacyl peptidase